MVQWQTGRLLVLTNSSRIRRMLFLLLATTTSSTGTAPDTLLQLLLLLPTLEFALLPPHSSPFGSHSLLVPASLPNCTPCFDGHMNCRSVCSNMGPMQLDRRPDDCIRFNFRLQFGLTRKRGDKLISTSRACILYHHHEKRADPRLVFLLSSHFPVPLLSEKTCTHCSMHES